MKMKKLLVFGLAVMFIFCAANAFAMPKDGPGWYTHTVTGEVKEFKSHPGEPSQWVFLGTENNYTEALAGDFGWGYTPGLGGYDFNNEAFASIQSYNSDVEAYAFEETTINFESDGFVEDIDPIGGGSAFASSGGVVNAWTDVEAGVQIMDFPYYGWDYNFYDNYFELYNVYEGSGHYNLNTSINLMAYQENGAFAEVGSDVNSTWAGGSNFSGGSINATQSADGTIEATQEIGWRYYYYSGWYTFNRVEGDLAYIGMQGFIVADGDTIASAYRGRDDNEAISIAYALTYSDSAADLYSFGNVPYELDSHVTAFGGGMVAHQTNATLPDGSAMAGTYGMAGYSYEGNGIDYAQGSGIAETFGFSHIERSPGTLSVHSSSGSYAASGASGNFQSNGYCD